MRVVVAMSGGVDSSVAAALVSEQGHDVVGVSMQLYDHSDVNASFGSCCTLDDLHDARRVAAAINIPHYILNFERHFDEHVVTNFVAEYAAGRTPLPCAHCNSDLKFATLAERAAALGADRVATGHYARVEHDASGGEGGRHLLKRGVDAAKDQSYFLFSLTQAQLAKAMFPVGDQPKHAVRAHARRLGLAVADKPDSQEICFVANDDYASFVAARTSPRAGAIVTEQGQVLGRHGGIHRFTVGQRKGLGIASPTGAPLYVLALRPDAAQVVVGPRKALERTTLTAAGVNWIVERPAAEVRATVQIRHRNPPAPATVRPLADDRAEVVFDTPQASVTPGQAAVWYEGEVVLGGGWIE